VPFLTVAVLLCVVLLLRLPDIRRSRWATLALIVAVSWQAGVAVYQSVSAAPRALAPYAAIRASQVSARSVPDSFGGTGFSQPDQFKLDVGRRLDRPALVALAPVRRERPPRAVTLSGQDPAGSLVATNVVYSPLVSATGQAQIIGRDPQGYAVLRIRPHDAQAWSATLTGACPLCADAVTESTSYLPLVIGQMLTVLAVFALLTVAAHLVSRRRRHRYQRLHQAPLNNFPSRRKALASSPR
jgi:hypothetical protein